jgi:hypothetical protein
MLLWFIRPRAAVRNAFDPLRGQDGEGWALEIESFLGPVKWHRADRRVPFGAQKTRVIKYIQIHTPVLIHIGQRGGGRGVKNTNMTDCISSL